jgi:hypothetical protein
MTRFEEDMRSAIGNGIGKVCLIDVEEDEWFWCLAHSLSFVEPNFASSALPIFADIPRTPPAPHFDVSTTL